jgi:hypothetical protein
MHYGVVLYSISDRWYVKDAGRRVVGTLAPLLYNAEEEQREWGEIVDWARKIVGIVE